MRNLAKGADVEAGTMYIEQVRKMLSSDTTSLKPPIVRSHCHVSCFIPTEATNLLSNYEIFFKLTDVNK